MEIDEREYERLKRVECGDPKLCEGEGCVFAKEHNRKLWSWPRFFIGIIKQFQRVEFWVFLIATVLFVLFAPKNDLGFWIAYTALGFAFMFFIPLSGLIGGGSLNVNANIGASINKAVNK